MVWVKKWNAILVYKNPFWFQAVSAIAVERRCVKRSSWPEPVRRINNDYIELFVSCSNIFHAVTNHYICSFVLKSPIRKERHELATPRNHLLINFYERHTPDIMLKYFTQDSTIAAANDKDVKNVSMRNDGDMRHHFMIYEFVLLRDLNNLIEN